MGDRESGATMSLFLVMNLFLVTTRPAFFIQLMADRSKGSGYCWKMYEISFEYVDRSALKLSMLCAELDHNLNSELNS
jgi:hypothetical protein